jgi:hypothetical protein
MEMKFRVLVILLAIPLSISAQKGFLGLRAGINWTNCSTVNYPYTTEQIGSFFATYDKNFRTGLSAGLNYEYFLNIHLSLRTELVYNSRGYYLNLNLKDQNGNPVGESGTTKYNFDYLSLPFKFGYTMGEAFYGFAYLGIVPSVDIDSKIITITKFSNGYSQTDEMDVTYDVARFDFAGLLEAGGGYKMGRFRFFTSISYQHSFTNITSDTYFAESTIKHYGIALSFGLKYQLKKE